MLAELMIRIFILFIFSLLVLQGCQAGHHRPQASTGLGKPAFVLKGKASWYGGEFNGRRTANGETYNMNALTAAHKSLPFGSRILVTNTQNNKSLLLRVNDRGPYVKGRIVDVSYRAAKELEIIQSGVADVIVEVFPASSEENPSSDKPSRS